MSLTILTHSRLANSIASRAVSCHALRRACAVAQGDGPDEEQPALIDGRDQQHRLNAGHQDIASAGATK